MNFSPSRALRLLAGAALIAIMFGCGGNGGPSAHSGTSGDTAAAAVDTTGMPRLEMVTAPQVIERVHDSAARATIVNVWATWCTPCREEFPELVRLAEAHRADGLRVLFVSADFDDQREAVREFLTRQHAPAPWLMKTGGDMQFIDGLDPRWSGALPATLVYDAAGRPVQFWEGRADYSRFESAVAPLLAASTTR